MDYEEYRQYKNYINSCKNKIMELEELLDDLEHYKKQVKLTFEEWKNKK